MLCVINRVDKQVHKPCKRVLVHGLNVGQISDGEEEDGGVDCDWFVTQSCYVDLLLCCFCYGLRRQGEQEKEKSERGERNDEGKDGEARIEDEEREVRSDKGKEK